jgi:hypothetical protein
MPRLSQIGSRQAPRGKVTELCLKKRTNIAANGQALAASWIQ